MKTIQNKKNGKTTKKIRVLLEMIQFKLTIFALPFAFIGAFLAARGFCDLRTTILILIAMIGARTCAMTFNRIVDSRFDAANIRTKERAIPAGEISFLEAWLLAVVSGGIFFLACFLLNPLTFKLSPLALGLTLFYSFTKRFTCFCHIILGVALAFSPFGGWVAVSNSVYGYPFTLSFGVIFWVAGFDAVYACLDTDFDRKAGLCSFPAILGREKAFRLAAVFHCFAFIFFTGTGIMMNLHWFYYLGILISAIALIYQHHLVKPDDLRRIHASFFSMNGIISITLFIAATGALFMERCL